MSMTKKMIPKKQREDYIKAVEEWLEALKNWSAVQTEDSSNPPPPPPPTPK